MNLDILITAREAEHYPPLRAAGINRHLIYTWRTHGHLTPAGQRGRSPLYRLRDILTLEHTTRTSGYSHRGTRHG